MEGTSNGLETNSKKFSKRYLFEKLLECPYKNIQKKLDYLQDHIVQITNCPENNLPLLKKQLSYFRSEFTIKWSAATRNRTVFIKKNSTWLETFVEFPSFPVTRKGRPCKLFEECSDRSKRRKTEELRERVNSDELVFATQMTLRATGKGEASKILKDITSTSPGRAHKYRSAFIKSTTTSTRKMSPSEALCMFVEAELSRRQYEIIQSNDKAKFPCYSYLKRAKQECYPKQEAYKVSSVCAEINLQDLVDLTCTRLFQYLFEALETLRLQEKENLELISKWGCDGSHQSTYKQHFDHGSDTDANLLQSSFVPLRLIAKVDNKIKIVWQNPTPSSPRYCRPIRFRFVRESADTISEEYSYINQQVLNLQKSVININDQRYSCSHTFLLTMLDGKTCNALSGTTSTQKCYLCGATSKDFNKLEVFQRKTINNEFLQFGLSILHARIKFLESVLHLAYKLPLQKWQVRSEEEKIIVRNRKKEIQELLKTEMGLLVDIPKQGFGNTNDGNTSRRFFSNTDMVAKITGVDHDLIYKYKIILETISSGHEINIKKFSAYATDTAKLYIDLCPWYPMPPTIHKILIHGATVISSLVLPIGQLSEEATESCNKYFKKYRLDFSRKFSREKCNMDVLNRLILKSDPLLNNLRKNRKLNKKQFSPEVLQMLLAPEVDADSNDENTSD